MQRYSLNIGFNFGSSIELQKPLMLETSPQSSFLRIVEHISGCGFKVEAFEILKMQAMFTKKEALFTMRSVILKPDFYLKLNLKNQKEGILIVGLKRPLLSSIIIDRRWHEESLQLFDQIVNQAMH